MLKKISDNPDLMGVIIITVGSYIANFFAYLLQYFLGRFLTIAEYGEFNTFLAITYFLLVPSQVLGTSLIKFVSEKFGKKEMKKLAYMFPRLVSVTVLPGVVFLASLIFMKNSVADYLKLNNSLLVVYFGMMIATSYLIVVPAAYMQGLLRYKAYALTSVGAGVFRLLFPVAAVMAGYGLYGVFGGITLGAVVVFIFSIFLLKKNLAKIQKDDIASDYKKIFLFSFPVLFVNFGMIMLNNIDIILVKKLFTPEEAGYYAGVVTLGKILLFGTSTIAVVMYPKISNLFSQGASYFKKLLFFFALQIVTVALGTAVFSIFPEKLTIAFFGDRFSDSIKYLSTFSIFIGMYVLVNFLVMFLLAVERTRVFLVLLPFVFIQYILIKNASGSLYDVINTNIYVTLVLLTVLLGYSLLVIKSAHSQKDNI